MKAITLEDFRNHRRGIGYRLFSTACKQSDEIMEREHIIVTDEVFSEIIDIVDKENLNTMAYNDMFGSAYPVDTFVKVLYQDVSIKDADTHIYYTIPMKGTYATLQDVENMFDNPVIAI